MNPSLNAFRPGRLLVAASLTASLLSLSVQAATLTRDNGAPVGDNQNSQTAGPNGSVLLQDDATAAEAATFRPRAYSRTRGACPRHRRPWRVRRQCRYQRPEHGQGLPQGREDPGIRALLRGGARQHSPETLRDPRGFATKFYTADGNWDLVGNNFPTFFIRDAIKFPDMVHAFKPDPRSNLDDDSRRFDFFSHVPRRPAP